MHKGWRPLQRLHQIGRQRVLQQRGHGAMGFQIAGAHGFPIARIADDDVGEALLQILEIGGETEDRHHFGCHRDVEAVLAREAVGDTAQRRHDLAQRAVVHVQHPPPGDAALIDIQRISPIDVIVDQGGEQIVRRGDGVEIAGEMQVDVFHRHDLGVAAARRAALHAEGRPERRLAQTQHRLLADMVERVRQADRRRRLAFARRSGRDRRDQNQLAVGTVLQGFDEVHRQLGFVMAIGVEILRIDAEALARDFHDRNDFRGLRNLDIGFGGLVLRSRHEKNPLDEGFSRGACRQRDWRF